MFEIKCKIKTGEEKKIIIIKKSCPRAEEPELSTTCFLGKGRTTCGGSQPCHLIRFWKVFAQCGERCEAYVERHRKRDLRAPWKAVTWKKHHGQPELVAFSLHLEQIFQFGDLTCDLWMSVLSNTPKDARPTEPTRSLGLPGLAMAVTVT